MFDAPTAKRCGPAGIRSLVITLLLITSTGFPATAGLIVPRDSSFSVVPFAGEDPLPSPPLYRNDDGSSNPIPLPFAFQFFGTPYSSVFINNNGTISFGSGISAFTPSDFPVEGLRMIGPFWADVDTRDPHSGVVYYTSEAHRFVVIWDSVGYSPFRSDKRNTFEIVLTDGTDGSIGQGNNVAFSYADMQWTTGGSSGGSGGFGGIPAMVGINRGDSVTSSVVGRFDHEGVDYGGPTGPPGGVSYLDDRLFEFSISAGWTIYPGDANADGIVDVRDILPLGRYFGKTGPVRPGASLVWGPQDLLQAWNPPEACYADCNGDGTINGSDVTGIIQNWFRTRLSPDAPQVDRAAVCEALVHEIDGLQSTSEGMIEIRNALLMYLKNELGIVSAFALEQNWPNPFNPHTTIQFSVPEQIPEGRLSIYSLLGQLLWEKRFTDLLPGRYEVTWKGETTDGTQAASGIYIYRLHTGKFVTSKRMLLLK